MNIELVELYEKTITGLNTLGDFLSKHRKKIQLGDSPDKDILIKIVDADRKSLIDARETINKYI